jgi:hypothetical protein
MPKMKRKTCTQDGRCSCKPCPPPKFNPAKLAGYSKEVYDRLWKLRQSNPRWELVWQEDSLLGDEDYKPVVDGTVNVLPDGTLAYLFDACPPLHEAYQELLYAVARKFPGETRHQTALRYIREAEKTVTTAGSAKETVTKRRK